MELLEGYHITQTEKSAIYSMIKNGWCSANNRPNTKSYLVIQGTPSKDGYVYKIRIGTRCKFSIGGDIEWRYSNITIRMTDKERGAKC